MGIVGSYMLKSSLFKGDDQAEAIPTLGVHKVRLLGMRKP